MKRLVKKSELFDAGNIYGKYVEVFINPTSKEIKDTFKSDINNSIRGVIIGNDMYIWIGNITHDKINGYVDKQFDVYGGLRFTYSNSEWYFDTTVSNFTSVDNVKQIILNNENKLISIASLNSKIHVGYINQQVYEFNNLDELRIFQEVT